MTWEYLAGFFDGEGTICFAHYKYRKGESRYIVVAVSQSENARLILDEISTFLNSYKIKHRFGKDKKFNPTTGADLGYQIRLYLSGMGNCREFLEIIKDKLIVKRAKAYEALAFINENKLGIHPTQTEKEHIFNLFNQCRNATEVAQKVGRTRQLVYKVIREIKQHEQVLS